MTGPAVPPQVPVSHSKPLRVISTVVAVLIAAQTMLPRIDGLPEWVPNVVDGLIILILVGLTKWTEGQVTPWADVAAKVNPDNRDEYVAGPAAPGVIVPGEVVSVTDDKLSPYSPNFEGPAERRYHDLPDEH